MLIFESIITVKWTNFFLLISSSLVIPFFLAKKKTFCGFLFQILLVLASIITNIRAIVSNFFSSSTNKHRRTSHFYQILFLCIRSFIKYKYLYVFNQLLLNIWAREINRISVVCKFKDWSSVSEAHQSGINWLHIVL